MRQYFFYNMLLIQLLTIAHVLIQISNKGYIYGGLKDCNFKNSKTLWKIWKCQISISNILKERPRRLQNPLLLKTCTYAQWITQPGVERPGPPEDHHGTLRGPTKILMIWWTKCFLDAIVFVLRIYYCLLLEKEIFKCSKWGSPRDV